MLIEVISSIDEPGCPLGDRCHSAVDVVYRTSDGHLLGGHSKDISNFCEEFPTCNLSAASPTAPIKLDETSEVISELLQYLHPNIPTETQELSFDLALAIAKAARKYVVYFAIRYYELLLERYVESHPLPILQYAFESQNRRLQVAASTHTLTHGPHEVYEALKDHPAGFHTWYQQRQAWQSSIRLTITMNHPVMLHKGGATHCNDWKVFNRAVSLQLVRAVVSETFVPETYSLAADTSHHLLQGCKYCLHVVNTLKTRLRQLRPEPLPETDDVLPEEDFVMEFLEKHKRNQSILSILFSTRYYSKHPGNVDACDGLVSFQGALAARQLMNGQIAPESYDEFDRLLKSHNGTLRGCKHCDIVMGRMRTAAQREYTT